MGLLGRLFCLIGHHDYRWNVTMDPPGLNWEECTRCGHVHPDFKHHYEQYQDTKPDK